MTLNVKNVTFLKKTQKLKSSITVVEGYGKDYVDRDNRKGEDRQDQSL